MNIVSNSLVRHKSTPSIGSNIAVTKLWNFVRGIKYEINVIIYLNRFSKFDQKQSRSNVPNFRSNENETK